VAARRSPELWPGRTRPTAAAPAPSASSSGVDLTAPATVDLRDPAPTEDAVDLRPADQPTTDS